MRFERALAQAALSGVVEWVPTFRSCTFNYDPLAAGADIFEASILGNVAAAVEVLRIGNVPVTRLELESKLTGLLEPILEVKS